MKALRYAERLIQMESTSHLSNRKIAKYIDGKLQHYGFVTEKTEYHDENGVLKVNVVGKKGRGIGGLAYFCHNDVVPADDWHSDKYGPTEPAIARERLYGRGSCDMKGSIACMLEAQQAFSFSDLSEPFYFVCTADEEVGMRGAWNLTTESKFYREMVEGKTRGIIGEPTMLEVVHAHKGGCKLTTVALGKSGHSSTREAINANLAMIPFLNEMRAIWDETQQEPKWQNENFDPPTLCWNIGINDHTAAVNMTAGSSICTVFFRSMPGINVEPLVARCKEAADRNGLEFSVDRMSGPLWTDPQSEFVQKSLELARRNESRAVGYGTDGGVFTELDDLIVFGPGNIAQAHTNDEWIAIEQLAQGVEMYLKFIREFCT